MSVSVHRKKVAWTLLTLPSKDPGLSPVEHTKNEMHNSNQNTKQTETVVQDWVVLNNKKINNNTLKKNKNKNFTINKSYNW